MQGEVEYVTIHDWKNGSSKQITKAEALADLKTVSSFLGIDYDAAVNAFTKSGYNVFNEKWKMFLREKNL